MEASFKSSRNSISILVQGVGKGLRVAFATEDGERFHAKIKTTRLTDKEEVPTKFGNIVALLQTSLDKDPDNPLNYVLRNEILDQIKDIRITLV